MEHFTLDADYVPLGSGEPRSLGLHLTDVIKSIEKEMGWNYQGKGFKDQWLTMDLGFVWEEVLSKAWSSRHHALSPFHEMIFRPGEVEKDGIVGSPDSIGPMIGLIKSDGTVMVEPSPKPILYEYKLTWKSIKNSLLDNWYYATQAKAYCAMTSLTSCFWHVCYLMGDYKGSGPLYRQCYVEFTQAELDANWDMILSHAKEKGLLK